MARFNNSNQNKLKLAPRNWPKGISLEIGFWFQLLVYLLLSPAVVAGMGLAKSLDLALRNDALLAVAESTRQAVYEIRVQRRGQLLPSLSFRADTTDNAQDRDFGGSNFGGKEGFNSHGYALRLIQPIYQHELWVQFRQTDALIAQAEAEYAIALQDVMIRIAEAYFEVLAAQDNLSFSQREKQAIRRQLQQAQQRFEVGLNAITEVHEAQAAFDLAVATEIEAENQVQDSQELLRIITGRLLEPAPLRAEMALRMPDPPDPEAWVSQAKAYNLTLRSARYAVEIARQEIRVQQAGHYASFDLVADHRFQKSGGGSLGGSEVKSSSISLQVSVPLFLGGQVYSRVREAEYGLQKALAKQENQRRIALTLTRTTFRGTRTAIHRVKALQQAVISNESALEATEAGFQVGTRTLVDVLSVQRNLFRARRDYARERYAYLLNSLRLKQAVGILSEKDLQQIDTWLLVRHHN